MFFRLCRFLFFPQLALLKLNFFITKIKLMGKYDKLIKESLSHLIKPFAKRVGIDLEKERLELIKDKLQQTVEREPDFLFIVRHNDLLKDYVTQFDFQVGNDMTMPERMLFYKCLIKYTHHLPVRQIVFYIGNGPLLMSNFLQDENTYHQYELYDIRIFKASTFLDSDIPQEILLAILGDFEGVEPEIIMENILLRLQKLVKRKKDFQKFTFQLHVLSGLRNLHKIFQLKTKNMPLQFDLDVKSDPFFLEGKEEGIEIGMTKKDFENVKHLLINTDFPDEQIAFYLNVKLAFIDEVRNKINSPDSQFESPQFEIDEDDEDNALDAMDNKDVIFVRNLLLQTDFSDEKIASLANVSLLFVAKVKKSLEKPKS